MAKNNEIGKHGEDLACAFLLAQGYRIMERNYRYKRNEIDIIAFESNVMVFIEVKTRNSKAFGNPEDFLSTAQKKRIIEAAVFYLDDKKVQSEIRFDIIAVEQNNEIVHLKDAFYCIDGNL